MHGKTHPPPPKKKNKMKCIYMYKYKVQYLQTSYLNFLVITQVTNPSSDSQATFEPHRLAWQSYGPQTKRWSHFWSHGKSVSQGIKDWDFCCQTYRIHVLVQLHMGWEKWCFIKVIYCKNCKHGVSFVKGKIQYILVSINSLSLSLSLASG